jgi:hypothetical protein
MTTAKKPGIDNGMVNSTTETRAVSTAHPMVRVREEEDVGIALAVVTRSLYVLRLGTVKGLFAPYGLPS